MNLDAVGLVVWNRMVMSSCSKEVVFWSRDDKYTAREMKQGGADWVFFSNYQTIRP
jgi:hypothetical protein